MKKLNQLIFPLLIIVTSLISNSCGSSEDTTVLEEVKLENGEDHSLHLINSVESGKIEIDKTGSKDLIDYFKINDKGDEYLYDEIKFDGYKFARSYKLYNDMVGTITYETFYEEKNEAEGVKTAKEILIVLKEKLGNPDDYGDSYNEWDKKEYKVTFNVFDDGYTLLIDSHLEHDISF